VIDAEIGVYGEKLPQDCCYQEDSTGTQIQVENLAIPASSVKSFGSISSSSEGLLVTTFTQFDLTFYYKVCEDLIGCDTILFCKGDADLLVEVETKFIVDITGGLNGEPELSFHDFNLHLSIPSKNGLCFTISLLLDSAIPVINVALNKVIPAVISSEFDKINALNQTMVLPYAPFDIHWEFTNQTGTSLDGLGLQFVIDILLKSQNNQPGPFLPYPALPAILTLLQQDEVSMDVTDSLANNIIYSWFIEKSREWDFDADGWKVKLNLLSSPEIKFTSASGDDAEELIVKTKTIISKSLLRFTITTLIVSHFDLVVTPNGELYLQISPTDFVVTIESIVPPVTNATKTYIQNQIENEWAAFIPSLNEVLLNHSIALPHIADFSDPEITYYDGYAYLSFDSLGARGSLPLLEGLTSSITRHSMDAVLGAMGDDVSSRVQCPDLSSGGFTAIQC